MEMKTLEVTSREGRGTGPSRRLRVAGSIPAVVYGEGQEPVHVSVNVRTFEKITHSTAGEHAVVKLDVTDKPEWSGPAMIKAVQHHPVRSHVVHADFFRIDLNKRIQTVVPIVLVGRSKGVIDGGVPDHQLHAIDVECLALDVPVNIEIDITELGIGDSLHVEQIQAPKGVTITTESDRTVVAIHAPRVVEAAPGEEGAEAGAEPAIVGEEETE